MPQSRRTFLKSSATAALALSSAPLILNAQSKAPAPRTLALIGAGWWGTNILNCAFKDGRSKLVALCDPDAAQLKKCAGAVSTLTTDTPKHYTDYRELLDKEKPQLVIVATPDHWHPLITIAAVRAGAHVYVEKPISHTVHEGTAMVAAARETGKVVQVGTHRRVSPHNISARDFIRSGKLGKIGAIKCFVYGGGGEEKPAPNAEPPKDLNWDLWCGPAPLRPFNQKIHPRGFRHFLDYANGQLGDWGIHWIDQVLWIMEKDHPTTIFSTGGRPVKGAPVNNGQQQTTDAPDNQVVSYTFDDFTLTWEHRQFADDPTEKHAPIGVHFYGTKGVFHLGWQDGWTFYPIGKNDQPAHEDAKFSGQKDSENIAELWKDFVDAIEQNRKPACDIEAGHRATSAALLGMLSQQLGRSIKWDGKNQTILNDPEAAALLRRTYRAPWQYPALS
ncbi:MAG TPA: Gfo/Idh/MocA family oxidoreductase [Tepidisphaeraceae bacterium]|jgi:predicted dehydrogenase